MNEETIKLLEKKNNGCLLNTDEHVPGSMSSLERVSYPHPLTKGHLASRPE